MKSTLSLGDKGLDVRDLQATLAMLVPGFEAMVVDGKFGRATKLAVQKFQRGVSLTPDGIVGPKTWSAIDMAVAKKSDSWLHILALKLRKIFGKLPTGLEKFEFETQGPVDDEHPPVPAWDTTQLNQGKFVNGWYSEATRWPMHVGRVGPLISPKSVVVHTTDTQPGAMGAVLRAWRDTRGVGSGAHFFIGKTPAAGPNDISGGIFQLAPIYRNANHAGGSPGHGWFKTKAGALIHPNTCTIGIEVDNAGRLKKVNDRWVHTDSGRHIVDPMVYVDDKGRGWERITPYQMSVLRALLAALDLIMPRFEEGVVVVPNGTYKDNGVSPEAALPGVRFVGHWTLDPNRKNDPGPQITEYLRTLK